MLLTGAYALVSGLLADLFGFPRFLLHSWAGYACALFVLVHLALNRHRIAYYLRFRPPSEKKAPPAPSTRSVRLDRRGFLLGMFSGLAGFLVGLLFPLFRRPATEEDWGQQYHRWSKPGGSGLDAFRIDWGVHPVPFKTYPQAPRAVLPSPAWRGPSIGEVIAARRSRREYVPGPLSLEELSVLLHAAQGITEPRWGFRAAPSAGALYPIETYVVVHNVAGLDPGLYHYAVADHTLEQIRTGDLRAELVRAGIGQEMLGTAQVCFILTAVFGRTRWRYRERAYRYILLEAGHIGQNIYLAATGLGLGACAVGAFLDDAVNRLLGVDGEEEATLYLLSVGRIGG
ncbi:MAG: SagB/ThcOx family dehydrogenase [Anaerolineae bacterium]|nr:SagB/ThcOx family dehydrogenase [Anaerolineae bacterium]MCX8068605.1 SagB/ThcOx family dehydrogenase [Anaerolineae bacterium]MDW7992849.1 SagB/ThcOx family dehydrogenase [Anaerolineae bacterium]